MGCDENNANIQLYVDNELTGDALEAFQAHLETCPDCQKEVEAAKELLKMLHRSRPLYSAPDLLRDRIIQATAKPPKGGKRGSG